MALSLFGNALKKSHKRCANNRNFKENITKKPVLSSFHTFENNLITRTRLYIGLTDEVV